MAPVSTLALRKTWSGLLDVVYPPACVSCGRIDHSGLPICWRCEQRLERAGHGPPADIADSGVDAFVCLWRYEKGGALQRAHNALKYSGMSSMGLFFGDRLGAELARLQIRPDKVIPVPLHRIRYLERGYNQAALIGLHVARRLGCPYDDRILSRRLATASQTRLSRVDREKNVRDAFRVRFPARIRNLHLLLVDDILTTGATVTSAGGTLKAAGARRVTAAAVGLAAL